MIYLLGGYMWLYVHRPFEIWPTLGTLQIERGYMFVMMLVWLINPEKGYSFNRLHLALAAFATTLGAAWLLSPYANSAGCLDVVENYAKVGVFTVMVVTTVRDEKNLRLLLLLFLGAVSVYMAHSLLEFARGRYQWRMGTARMSGVDVTFGDPNAFASTLLYTLPLLLPFWFEQPRRVPRTLILGYLGAVGVCILLTGSRAGFAGSILLALVLVISNASNKFQAVLLCAVTGAVLFVILSIALPEDLQNRYKTLVDSSKGPENAQHSALGRLDGFVTGIDLWQKSPLLGHGPGSFQYATRKGFQAHNIFGQVLAEMGLLGAVALTVLVACFALNFKDARRLALADLTRDTRNNFAYQATWALCVNGFLLLVMGLAGHNLYRYNWQWFAAFSAVALYCLQARATSAEQAAYSMMTEQVYAPYPQVGYYTRHG